jgi:hypothetical protein
MNKSNKFFPEGRERAVRVVQEHRAVGQTHFAFNIFYKSALEYD